MIIFKQFTFDAAHFLPQVPEGHKCKNLHGHTYHLTVYVETTVDAQTGWVIDFGELKQLMNPILQLIDHQLLNEVPGLGNPTAENMAIWIWNKLKPSLPALSKIELKETPTSGVIYDGR